MSKKIFWIVPVVTLLFVFCKSQSQIVDNAAIQPAALENALLWEISGKKLDKPSYLYGTIHIINSDDYFFPEGTLTAFDRSEKVIFEIDMSQMNDMSQLMPLLQKAFMENGTTLKDLLSAEEYGLVKAHFQKIGLPIFFLEKIKPLFLTAFGSGDFNPTDIQSGKIKSYEMEFSEMAADSGKEMGGLETIDFQLSLFDSIPYADQAKMLIDAIVSVDTENDQFANIVSVYKNQDINSMFEMMQADEGISEFEDILVTKRNQSWISPMEAEMAVKPCFFAVGAGHLGGPDGVITLLRKAGYSVRPLSGVPSE